MASLIDALMEAQAGLNSEFANIYGQTKEATGSLITDTEKSSDLKQQVEAQKLADDNSAIQVGKVLARALGADPNASNYRLEKLAATKTQATDEAMAATQQYEQLSQTSFLDNPLTWLMNQFQKDSVAEQANAATMTSALATQEMQDINQQIQQGVMTHKIVAETVNEDLTAKKLELSALANKEAADRLRVDALAKNTDALKAVMTGNGAMMSAAQHQESVILQQQHMAQAEQHFQLNRADQREHFERQFGLSVAQFEESRKQHDISNDFKQQSADFALLKRDDKQEAEANKLMLDLEDRALKAEKAGKKDEAKTLREQLVQTKKQFEFDKALAIRDGKIDNAKRYRDVVAALGAEGLIAIPDNIYDAEKVINEGLKLAKNPQDSHSQAWKAVSDTMASVLQQQKADPNKHPVIPFGFTPLEAAANMQVLNPKLEPAQARTAMTVRDQIDKTIQQVKKDDPGINQKELKAAVDYKVAKYFADSMKDPESNDITRLPKPAELANFGVAKKGGKFFTTYIAPKIEAGDTDTSFEAISSLATKALLSKDINMNELASELSSMYSEAITYNNAKQGYSRFGIPMMNRYMIYGIGERELDLTNPTDVKTALIFKSLQSNIGGGLLRGVAPGAFNWLANTVVESANPEDLTRR